MTQSQESTVKPLFGFRALMADLADWIREHRMTLGFVLFITLFNVGMQLVCGIRHTQFPPQLSRVSFDVLAHGRWYTAPISLLSVPQLGRLLIDIPLILIALTVTGPFGDPSEYAEDLTDFATFCTQHSWTPVFYSVHESQRAELTKAGWDSLDVGTEMVVNPNEWQTRGKKWQDVRTAINKAKRDGITDVLTTFKEAPFSVQTQIREISAQWAGKKALPEMGFTLGGVDELIDSRVRLLYAVDGNGKVLGVTSWLPTYRDGTIIGWTLDFMRHRTDSVNGIMEFLIARMAERLRDEGNVEFMSLSAAPLAGMGSNESEHEESEVLRHALQMVADIMEPAYGFHSLFRFKLKFHPDEEKVYICYPDAAKLPQISLAVAQAYVPSLTPAEAMRFVRTIAPRD